jgi:mevalonate kinase
VLVVEAVLVSEEKECLIYVLNFFLKDVPQSLIDQVMLQLKQEGFDCYQTSVGGAGSSAVTLTKDETKNWLLEANRDTLEQYF